MKVRSLYDKAIGDNIAPITHPNAVLDEKGKNEAERIDEAIEAKAIELDLVNETRCEEIIEREAGELGLSDAATLVKTKYPNLLLTGEKDDRKISSEGAISAGGGYCFARKIAVKPNTCYYINREYDLDGTNLNKAAVWLEDEQGNVTAPLNSDGTERSLGYKLYQIYFSCGVVKTRSDSAYMHIGLGYWNGGANAAITSSEYCIESSHPVLYDEYYEAPQLANGLALKKKFKVLLIGSSYGQNTICALAPLAISAGIDITVGNLYAASSSLANTLDMTINDTSWTQYRHMTKYGNLRIGDTSGYSSRGIKPTVRAVLNDEDWDVVVLMRSAAETNAGGWTDTDSANLQAMINFIDENCPSHPRVVWNSGFAYPLGQAQTPNRGAQQAVTDRIMTDCETIKSTMGIDYIPVAKALQLCRNDEVVNDPNAITADLRDNTTIHLNNGIGMYITACCCFEYFFKQLYGMSVRTLTKVHTYAELGYRYGTNASHHGNEAVLTGNSCYYPTQEQARLIRKYAQIACL